MGDTSSVDISTRKNMEDLIQIGNDLLKKPAGRVNLETGTYEPIARGGTNADAIDHFVKKLSEERKRRHAKVNS